MRATLSNYHRGHDQHATLTGVGNLADFKYMPVGTRVSFRLEMKGHPDHEGVFCRNRESCVTFYSEAPIGDFPFEEDFTSLSAVIKEWSVVEKQEAD